MPSVAKKPLSTAEMKRARMRASALVLSGDRRLLMRRRIQGTIATLTDRLQATRTLPEFMELIEAAPLEGLIDEVISKSASSQTEQVRPEATVAAPLEGLIDEVISKSPSSQLRDPETSALSDMQFIMPLDDRFPPLPLIEDRGILQEIFLEADLFQPHETSTALEDSEFDLFPNNTRLALIGDACLAMTATVFLRETYPRMRLQWIAMLRGLLVMNAVFEKYAELYDLQQRIPTLRGSSSKSMLKMDLATLFEAYIGGAYKEFGFTVVKEFCDQLFLPHARRLYDELTAREVETFRLSEEATKKALRLSEESTKKALGEAKQVLRVGKVLPTGKEAKAASAKVAVLQGDTKGAALLKRLTDKVNDKGQRKVPRQIKAARRRNARDKAATQRINVQESAAVKKVGSQDSARVSESRITIEGRGAVETPAEATTLLDESSTSYSAIEDALSGDDDDGDLIEDAAAAGQARSVSDGSTSAKASLASSKQASSTERAAELLSTIRTSKQAAKAEANQALDAEEVSRFAAISKYFEDFEQLNEPIHWSEFRDSAKRYTAIAYLEGDGKKQPIAWGSHFVKEEARKFAMRVLYDRRAELAKSGLKMPPDISDTDAVSAETTTEGSQEPGTSGAAQELRGKLPLTKAAKKAAAKLARHEALAKENGDSGAAASEAASGKTEISANGSTSNAVDLERLKKIAASIFKTDLPSQDGEPSTVASSSDTSEVAKLDLSVDQPAVTASEKTSTAADQEPSVEGQDKILPQADKGPSTSLPTSDSQHAGLFSRFRGQDAVRVQEGRSVRLPLPMPPNVVKPPVVPTPKILPPPPPVSSGWGVFKLVGRLFKR